MKLNQQNELKNHCSYYPALDGLRGLAIFMILPGHNVGYVEGFIYAIRSTSRPNKLFLESTLINWLVQISYGVYVFHWPILVPGKISLPGRLQMTDFSHNLTYVLISRIAPIIVLIISWFNNHLFEAVFLQFKKKFA